MTEIFIIKTKLIKCTDEDFMTIYAKNKKDFFKQIDKLIKNKIIANDWELANNYSLKHKWFN